MGTSIPARLHLHRIHLCADRLKPLLVVLLPALPCADAFAAQWNVVPQLNVEEIYSDNIRLRPSGQEEQELVTQVKPGLHVDARGRRLNIDIDYALQFLYYLDEGSNNTNHQLNSQAQGELVDETLFMDAHAGITQQIISPDQRVAPESNIHLSGGRADVVTYGMSPYLQKDIGGVLATELRYSHDYVDYYSGGASDAEVTEWFGRLGSGRHGGPLSWDANYRKQSTLRETGQDSLRESASAVVRYPLTDTVSLVGRGGYENNQVQTSRAIEDGSYWSAGLAWTPSARFSLEATKGEQFEQARLSLAPTVRTSLSVSYSDREVGILNGQSWSGALTHRTRHSTWAVGYSEQAMDSQTLGLIGAPHRCSLVAGTTVLECNRSAPDLLTGERPFAVLVDPDTGQSLIDPATGELIIVDLLTGERLSLAETFTLFDEDFIRKRLTASGEIRGAKSTLQGSAFAERRELELSGNEERAYGALGVWSWRVAPRTRSALKGSWQRSIYDDLRRSDDLWSGTLSLSRQFRPNLSGTGEYSHSWRESNRAESEYRENRVTVRVTMTF